MGKSNDILYVGVNDHQVDLFEGQYVVPNGMAYHSYLLFLETEQCILYTALQPCYPSALHSERKEKT